MTIVNIERDMVWMDAASPIAVGASSTIGSSMTVNTSGSVGQRTNSAQCAVTALTSTGTFAAVSFGCLILEPPELETVPYRVKAAALGISSNDALIGYGYNTAGTVSQIRWFDRNETDQLVAVPSLDSADGDFGKPLCFFVAFIRNSTDSVTGFISVQRLISKPPQYASASS